MTLVLIGSDNEMKEPGVGLLDQSEENITLHIAYSDGLPFQRISRHGFD
jgi:hypothetical protein